MNYNITVTRDFEKSLKRLAKKYRSIKNDLQILHDQLSENPFSGDRVGENLYKIRIAIKSKGKGKSGGARVITYIDVAIVEEEEQVSIILVKIYDKSDYESIRTKEVEQILKKHFKRIMEE